MDLSRLAIQEELWSHQDVNYQEFNMQFMPLDVQPTVMGVRLPVIRKVAQEIAAEIGDDKAKLNTWFKDYNALRKIDPNIKTPDKAKFFYEERLIAGFVVAYSSVCIADKAKLIKSFVEKIDNWAACDSFSTTFSLDAEEDYATFTHLIKTWMKAYAQDKIDNPYILRFVIVALLNHFFTEDNYEYALDLITKINHEAETVKMAKAWALSQYVAQQPEAGMEFLRQQAPSILDLETHRLTVRKISDSLRIEGDLKIEAKALLLERRNAENTVK